MKSVNINKNRKTTIIVLLLVLLSLAGSISYSLWNYSFKGKENKITTGDVSIKFLESNTNVISLKNALPEDDTTGKTNSSYDFIVTTKANYNINLKYDLSIEKLSTDTGYTSLNNNQIKVYLTDFSNNVLLEPTLISDLSNNLLYTKTNTHSSTKTEINDKYKLRVWIDKDVDASSWTKDTKNQYKFKIGIKSEEANSLNGVDTLIKKEGSDGLEKIVHSADSSLQIGATEDITEYRYRGANPNNYAIFNNETWRIIGVFPTEGSDGTIENRIKLIRSESIGDAYWNSNDGTTGLSSKDNDYSLNRLIDSNNSKNNSQKLAGFEPGKVICDVNNNNWATSALNSYLDATYYENIQNKNMIDKVKYYLGGLLNNEMTVSGAYISERQISGPNYFASGNDTNIMNYIALMYTSDYGYAASDKCNSSLNSYNTTECTSNNWLYSKNIEHLLMHVASSNTIFNIGSNGALTKNNCVNDKEAVRPVLYLKPNVKISGTGTTSDPYKFAI